MNRFAVILFALAILLAHALAIHRTVDGDYAPAYDLAHDCYRVARNLAREGTLAWNVGGPVHESYPSISWVLLAALAERLYVGPNVLTQIVGTLSCLLTVVVLAQFSPARLAGLIAPVLLAVSTAVAASGGSGTEAGFAMLLVAIFFLAFERGKPRWLAASATLLLWTRPDASVLVLVAWLLDRADRPRDVFGTRRPPLTRAFLVPLGAWVVLACGRRALTGFWISPQEVGLFDLGSETLAIGRAYVSSFFWKSGSGLLLVLSVLALATGRLGGTGRRALVLALTAAVALWLGGGDPLPAWNALVPVLPLYFLSVQAAIQGFLDRQPVLAPLLWSVLVAAVGASLLVSREPADLGPFRIGAWHRAWMRPDDTLELAFGRSHGRLGVMEEIREVERLRALGVYLRDRVEDPASMLTFWPGAIAYLSRKEVHDMLGRATPLEPEERTRSWRGNPRIDVLKAFERGVDYVIPIVGNLRQGSSPADILRGWLAHHDVVGDDDRRLLDVLAALADYELVAVPVPARSKDPRSTSTESFLVLRSRALQVTPVVSVEAHGRSFTVLVRDVADQQTADLTVRATDAGGTTWYVRPTGEFVREEVVARSSLLLFPSGARPIRLLEARVPPALGPVDVEVQLHNPGTHSEVPLAAVGAPARVSVDG